MDTRLALMTGIDIPIPECEVVVHQPTLKEISYIGESVFFEGAQMLCIDKNMLIQDESILDKTSNFQIFMTIIKEPEAKDKKASALEVLRLIFPQYKISYGPTSILMLKDKETKFLDENNFEIFQAVARTIFCFDSNSKDSFNPGNKKAREIAQKLMRGRQRVNAQKQGNGSVLAQYISTLTIGVQSMSLKNVIELTLYQLYDLMERYSLYVNWDIDIRSRLAGAKSDDHPEDWMKNIHNN